MSHKPIALVTGAGRGIGRATAIALSEDGYDVVAVTRSPSDLTGFTFVGDVRDEAFAISTFKQIAKDLGSVDLLVNNAGVLISKPFPELSLKEWNETFEVNVQGAFLFSRELFRQQSGRERKIINISSLGGLLETEKFPGLAAYTASKCALSGLTEALAVEGKSLGIDVFGIAPGAVNTNMLKQSVPGLKSNTSPEDIARVVIKIASSPKGRFRSGSILPLYTNE